MKLFTIVIDLLLQVLLLRYLIVTGRRENIPQKLTAKVHSNSSARTRNKLNQQHPFYPPDLPKKSNAE